MKFERRINYYETDAMGIVHHSNYIRFLEEARCYFLDSIGLPYKKIEDEQISIPVLEVNCKYHSPARYDDIICIDVSTKDFNGIRMSIRYEITNKETGKLVATAETKHCFTESKTLRPISLKKIKPEMYELLNNCE